MNSGHLCVLTRIQAPISPPPPPLSPRSEPPMPQGHKSSETKDNVYSTHDSLPSTASSYPQHSLQTRSLSLSTPKAKIANTNVQFVVAGTRGDIMFSLTLPGAWRCMAIRMGRDGMICGEMLRIVRIVGVRGSGKRAPLASELVLG